MKNPCSTPNCDRSVLAKGLCSLHYNRRLRRGTVELPVRPRLKDFPCVADGCDNPGVCRNMCRIHYVRWKRTGEMNPARRWRTNYKRTPPEERFWKYVSKSDDCWTWLGGKNKLGYGHFWAGPDMPQRRVMAHRFAYESVVGPIPPGLHIDHLCRNPSCVNPAHLEPVTLAENTRRGVGPTRGSEYNRRKTHCPQGHPYSPENTYRSGHGRSCKTCILVRTKARQRASRLGVPYVDPYNSDTELGSGLL